MKQHDEASEEEGTSKRNINIFMVILKEETSETIDGEDSNDNRTEVD